VASTTPCPARPATSRRSDPDRPTVAAALRRFVPGYVAASRPPARVRDVLQRLTVCRTAALGGHLARCAHCGWSRPVYNACGDRHCPTCQAAVRARWLAERVEKLLPVGHFQVVFTLPADLRPWARTAPEVTYDALFRAARDTLAELATSRLGEPSVPTRLGTLAVLHSWSNDLRLHPHVHCVVTAGGLTTDADGQPAWADSRPRFLFPVRVLGALFRGKLLATLREAWTAGELPDPPGERFDLAAKDAWRKRWVVHVDPPAGRSAANLTKYLARYVRGVAVSDNRIRALDASTVTVQTRRGPVRLAGPEFVRRFAQHILPKRFHAVRYWGLYAPSQTHTTLVQAWRLLNARSPDATQAAIPTFQHREPMCPSCGGALEEHALDGVPMHRPWGPAEPRAPP